MPDGLRDGKAETPPHAWRNRTPACSNRTVRHLPQPPAVPRLDFRRGFGSARCRAGAVSLAEQGTRLAVRRSALSQRCLRKARLAQAIAAEHGYGPKVAQAVDRSHHVMGMLQKETLKHIFAMRAVLRPDQAAQFDAAVVKTLTEPGQIARQK